MEHGIEVVDDTACCCLLRQGQLRLKHSVGRYIDRCTYPRRGRGEQTRLRSYSSLASDETEQFIQVSSLPATGWQFRIRANQLPSGFGYLHRHKSPDLANFVHPSDRQRFLP
ncbi:hypothetical protein PC111_g20248 [Phytophthora cactorum]|nr:hypothetical protein PC111_g20248 [Phytophthora cactorum]